MGQTGAHRSEPEQTRANQSVRERARGALGEPDRSRANRRLSERITVHESVPEQNEQTGDNNTLVVCKTKWSPHWAGQLSTYQISDIIGQGVIPPCDTSAGSTLSALESPSKD